MNWVAFAVIAWISLGLERGFRDFLRLGAGDVGPSFVIPLATWIALQATPRHALWAALALGLLLDLGWSVGREDGGSTVVVGPYAIGLFLGVNLVLAARGYVIRDRFFALGALSLLCAGATQIVVTSALTLRDVYDPIVWQAGPQLADRGLSAIYTGILALPLWLLYRPVEPLMGFPRDRINRRYG